LKSFVGSSLSIADLTELIPTLSKEIWFKQKAEKKNQVAAVVKSASTTTPTKPAFLEVQTPTEIAQVEQTKYK
jgi:hypothetical protein